MLQRLDKRKDRVEISPEQLSDASTQAEVHVKASECRMNYSLKSLVFTLETYHLSFIKCDYNIYHDNLKYMYHHSQLALLLISKDIELVSYASLF